MFLHNVLEKALSSVAIYHTDASFWWRRTWFTWWSSRWEQFESSSFRSAVEFANGALDGTFDGSADGDGAGSTVCNLSELLLERFKVQPIVSLDWWLVHLLDYGWCYNLIEGRGTHRIIGRATFWLMAGALIVFLAGALIELIVAAIIGLIVVVLVGLIVGFAAWLMIGSCIGLRLGHLWDWQLGNLCGSRVELHSVECCVNDKNTDVCFLEMQSEVWLRVFHLIESS